MFEEACMGQGCTITWFGIEDFVGFFSLNCSATNKAIEQLA